MNESQTKNTVVKKKLDLDNLPEMHFQNEDVESYFRARNIHPLKSGLFTVYTDKDGVSYSLVDGSIINKVE